MTNEGKQEVIYRHSGAVRVTHWVNVVALLVLLMSGLQIFNAHPALYLGEQSKPVITMCSSSSPILSSYSSCCR